MKRFWKYVLIFFTLALTVVLIYLIANEKQTGYQSTYNKKNESELWNAKEIGADYYGRKSSNRLYANQYEYCDKSKSPINWPPKDGCLADPVPFTVKKGTVIDRFGGPTGFFMSPEGYTYVQRSLPYISSEAECVNYYRYVYNLDNPLQNYHLYRVNKDFDVLACEAAPAFGAPGGAIQYKYSKSIQQLLDENFITELDIKNFPPFN
jgi:Tuberculosis necrotizing toxin